MLRGSVALGFILLADDAVRSRTRGPPAGGTKPRAFCGWRERRSEPGVTCVRKRLSPALHSASMVMNTPVHDPENYCPICGTKLPADAGHHCNAKTLDALDSPRIRGHAQFRSAPRGQAA